MNALTIYMLSRDSRFMMQYFYNIQEESDWLKSEQQNVVS